MRELPPAGEGAEARDPVQVFFPRAPCPCRKELTMNSFRLAGIDVHKKIFNFRGQANGFREVSTQKMNLEIHNPELTQRVNAHIQTGPFPRRRRTARKGL
jgi:hypothetical protein